MKDNWIKLPILDVTSLIKDGTHATHKDVPNGIPMLSAKDIVGGNVLLPDDARLISEMDFSQIHKTYKLHKDDVLLTLVGTIGRVAILKDYSTKFTFQRSVGILRFDEKVIPEYAYYYVSSEIFYKDLIRSMNASAQGGVYLGELGKIKICFPKPLPQQKKIAKILSTVDNVIEKTESAIAKYQAIKQGLMHDLFTRGIDVNTGKLRPTPQEAPELYKESALGLIPRDWEDSVFKNHLIKNLYGPRFSGDDYDSEGNVKTIRGMDFSKDGEILYSQAPIALLPKSKVYSHLLETGDVVMVTTADCGLTAVFEEQDFQFIPSAYSVKFRFNEEIEPYFIKFFMQTDKAKRLVNKYVRQGTLGNLPGSDVLGFNISLPKIDEQKIIIEKLKAVESKIQTEQQALAKYQQLKAGLLQDLLTGKVEVNVV